MGVASSVLKANDIEIRNEILQGRYLLKKSLTSTLKPPTFKLCVFVSSTFTDTQLERKFILDELLFELREEANKYGKYYKICSWLLLLFYVKKHLICHL